MNARKATSGEYGGIEHLIPKCQTRGSVTH